jgi:hypothetical protein
MSEFLSLLLVTCPADMTAPVNDTNCSSTYGNGFVSWSANRVPALPICTRATRPACGPSLRSADWPEPDCTGVTTFLTSELRWGWVPSLPRGRGVRVCGIGGRRTRDPTWPSWLTIFPATRHNAASTKVQGHSPVPAFPSPGWPGWFGRALDIPPGFAPSRYRGRTQEVGTAVDTQRGRSLATHMVRLRVALREFSLCEVLAVSRSCSAVLVRGVCVVPKLHDLPLLPEAFVARHLTKALPHCSAAVAPNSRFIQRINQEVSLADLEYAAVCRCKNKFQGSRRPPGR